MKKVLIALFVFALALRINSFYPSNIILGYDQIRDLFTTGSILNEGDIKIIGPTAGNNLSLHHGVAFWYFILPPLVLGGGNPLWVSIWSSVFNSLAVIVIYLISLSLFKNKTSALVSAFISAVSYYFIAFSGWIGNPSPTLLTVPLFFYFLWRFLNLDHKSLILSLFFLGLSIQFELFFIYLIPVLFLVFIIYCPKNLNLKLLLFSVSSFLISVSSMIATEIKYDFGGVKSIFEALVSSNSQGNGILNNFLLMWEGYGQIFYGKIIAAIVILFIALKAKDKSFKFLLIYLSSPFIMLLIGVHGAPWFLVGLAPAAVLATGHLISQLGNRFLIAAVCVLIFIISFKEDKNLLGADESAYLKKQLAVIDYTYEASNGGDFIINSVTNPLYINYVWSYHYPWYGFKKYGYLPTWAGGDQIAPYDTLSKPKGSEKILYLLIDETPRIPEIHKILAVKWANERSSVIEEKSFGGISVQKRLIF